MVLRPRTRPLLRRAVAAAALGALIVPAVADAKAKPKAPVITKVTPKTAAVGTKLTIKGKYFKRGKAKNSVLFRRDKGKALFVKADVSTTKSLTVVLPGTLEKYMDSKGSVPVATRFRLRVLSAKLSKKWSSGKLSPVISPAKGTGDGSDNSGGAGVPTAPDGDCDGDGVKNGVDPDDDNDLLSDAKELEIGTDPCVLDTDGDGVEDGFEYKSAIDLNNDDYQDPNYTVLYPVKTPYPNPLFKDAGTDFDGDSLSLLTEYKLWKYTYEVNHTATRTLEPMSYSDGTQFSLSVLDNGVGRRIPNMDTGHYPPPQAFAAWADATGYGRPFLWSLDFTQPRAMYQAASLFDVNRNGTVSALETTYWTMGSTDEVSDDERDEDGDGLSNYMEDRGPLGSPDWWSSCYANEPPFPIRFAGTQPFNADSDGDGILDGADDQDFDDVPNLMEISRNAANGYAGKQGNCKPATGQVSLGYNKLDKENLKIWVNPFNPCLPDPSARTCPRFIEEPFAPFIDDFKPFILN
jgi:hypothetical protein